jgi:DNA-binding beta-propeller fold protein YncE
MQILNHTEGAYSMKKLLLLFSLFFVTNAFAASAQYRVINKIELGGNGFWDYLAVDNSARCLYVSHGTQVVVVDLETDKVIGNIPDTPGVHGIALAPELNRGFISCGQSSTAVIFDLKTLKVLGKVKTGSNPDNILYDPSSRQVFTFNGRSNDATAFDAATGAIKGTIAMGGKPEAARLDGKGKIYVNIEDLNEIVEIDIQKLAISKHFSISPGEEPTGMAIDADHHRIFAACDNEILVVLDTGTGNVTATVPIGAGCDGVSFDSETGFIFCANGEDGTLTVIKESSAGKFEVVQNVVTRNGARTIAIDPTTHNLLLPVGQSGPPGGAAQPSTTGKDSFVVLVVGK